MKKQIVYYLIGIIIICSIIPISINLFEIGKNKSYYGSMFHSTQFNLEGNNIDYRYNASTVNEPLYTTFSLYVTNFCFMILKEQRIHNISILISNSNHLNYYTINVSVYNVSNNNNEVGNFLEFLDEKEISSNAETNLLNITIGYDFFNKYSNVTKVFICLNSSYAVSTFGSNDVFYNDDYVLYYDTQLHDRDPILYYYYVSFTNEIIISANYEIPLEFRHDYDYYIVYSLKYQKNENNEANSLSIKIDNYQYNNIIENRNYSFRMRSYAGEIELKINFNDNEYKSYNFTLFNALEIHYVEYVPINVPEIYNILPIIVIISIILVINERRKRFN